MKNLNRSKIIDDFALTLLSSFFGATTLSIANLYPFVYFIVIFFSLGILALFIYITYLDFKKIPNGTKELDIAHKLLLAFASSCFLSVFLYYVNESDYADTIINSIFFICISVIVFAYIKKI